VASAAAVSVVSLLAVVPCFWQQRIQAGDLSSHVYNAWLASFISSRHPAGLQLARQTTNFLFDEMLSLAAANLGYAAAERLVVAVAVLVFVWGAFRFAGRLASGRPWGIVPLLLIFAYGWTFHMGFFNFYLSLGICLWALSYAIDFRWPAAALALPFALLAWMAHPLPVLWSAGAITWAAARQRLRPRTLFYLGSVYAVTVALVSIGLQLRYPAHWSAEQLFTLTGADQAWLFDTKYYLAFAGILFAWAVPAMRRAKSRESGIGFGKLPAQLALLTAFSAAVLPGRILLPGYGHGLEFITERMSIIVAMCILASMAGTVIPRGLQAFTIGLALVYFGMMYHDWRGLNRLEDRLDQAVAQLPGGTRVITALRIPGSRIPAATHLVDRACIGRCFSYANYEASTGQFRLRATAPNLVVVSEYAVSYQMKMGAYAARAQDGPLFQLAVAPAGVTVKPLLPGERQTISVVSPF